MGIASNRVATEQDKANPLKMPSALAEEVTASFSSKAIRLSVIRLPPSVHDKGDHGFIPILIGTAQRRVYQLTLLIGSTVGLPFTVST